jgi:D-glycero-D-manno-heptose 1,7-bisphosphate phosphatase
MTPMIAAPIVTANPEAAGLVGDGSHRALFLDRDGVINVNHGYVHTPEQTEWVPGIFDLARAARGAGFVLIVVTNQAGIARGYYTLEQFECYTRWVHEQFALEGAPLLATCYCPHHPDAGIGDLRVECDCRKPKSGMLDEAVKRWRIDPGASVMLGDHAADMEAATRAGLGLGVLVRSVTAMAAAQAAITAYAGTEDR